MADIKVRIEVNPNAESEMLGNVVNNLGAEEVSNVSVKTDSKNIFTQVPTQANAVKGINGLSLGQDLVFDAEGYLDNQDLKGAVIEDEQNPYEFVWGFVPSNGKYSVKLTFTNAQNLKDIIVYGDSVVGQFPTRAIINETTEIYSDDNRWAINLQEERETHTIEFTDWNRPNYNACLSLISVMLQYYNVDKLNGLMEVESLSQSTARPEEIFYGIVPNSGSLEILDYDGEIEDMIRDGVIPNSNVKVDIFANGKKVQNHITIDSDYDLNSKMFSVELANSLDEWNNIKYAGLGVQFVPMTLYQILQKVFKATLNIDDIDYMLTSEMVYGSYNQKGTVKNYLESIKIPYPYLQEATLTETITKICTVAQLTVIHDNDGVVKFISARPKYSSNEPILTIPKRMQNSRPTKDLILKNKYTNCNVETYNVEKEIDNNTPAISHNVDNRSSSVDYPATIDSDTRTDTSSSSQIESVARVQSSYIEGSFDFVVGETRAGQNFYAQKVTAIRDNFLNINIDTLPKLYESNDYVSFDANYTLYTYEGTVQRNYALLITEIANMKDEWNDYEPNDVYLEEVPQSGAFGGSISAESELQSDTLSKVSLKDETSITITKKSGNIYTCTYKLLANKDEMSAYLFYPMQEPNYSTLYRKINKYRADSLTINLLGTKITFNFNSNNETQASTDNYTYNLTTNELMQDKATTQNENLAEVVRNNIINDYSNGISTATVSVKCLDVYDINKTPTYKFENGEIFKVGDIVRIDKDNEFNSMYKYSDGTDMLFRVTGRPFKKRGVPLIDLELQEVK